MSLNISLSSGDIASIITAIGTLVIGVLQVLQKRQSIVNARKIDETSAKLDKNTATTEATAAKVDENTALTRDTAVKVEAVHQATTAIAEASGTFPTIKEC